MGALCGVPPVATIFTATAAVIVNALLTADVLPGFAAVSLLDPTRSIERSLNVARPEELVTWLRVPLSVPVPEDSEIVIVAPPSATGLPPLSWSCTVTAGVIGCPAVVLVGCWTKASWLAEEMKTHAAPAKELSLYPPRMAVVASAEIARDQARL